MCMRGRSAGRWGEEEDEDDERREMMAVQARRLARWRAAENVPARGRLRPIAGLRAPRLPGRLVAALSCRCAAVKICCRCCCWCCCWWCWC